MRSKMHTNVVAACLLSATTLSASAVSFAGPRVLVGPQTDGSYVLPTSQVIRAAGRQIGVLGRPSAIAIRPSDHNTAAFVQGQGAGTLVIIDLRTAKVLQELNPFQGSRPAVNGVLYSPDGNTLFASDNANSGSVDIYNVASTGLVSYSGSVTLPNNPNLPTVPAGLALSADSKTLYVALNGLNTLGIIDIASQTLTGQIAVGNAPYGVVVSGSTAWVTNQGGIVPGPNDPVNPSAGTNILVNPATAAASTGSVAVVDLKMGNVANTIQVGLDPSALVLRNGLLFVTNTNSDTISAINTATNTVAYTFPLFPSASYGSQPNDINFLPDGRMVVSLGGNNALALYSFHSGTSAAPSLAGLIPTGWYPGFIAVDPKHNTIDVVNVRGLGNPGPTQTRGPDPSTNKTGFAEVSTVGDISLIKVPDEIELVKDTFTVLQNNSFDGALNAFAAPATASRSPVPYTLGAHSPIKHVFYVIKENRTYDQILGDDPRGNGDPTMTQFGAFVTPNIHKLSRDYVLLDNFYAPSLNSADGHQWVNQALAPDYLEKELNTNARSYPSAGGDPLAYASSGFLWENLVQHGGTLRVYGEYAYEGNGPNNLYGDWSSWYQDALILEGKATGPLHAPLGSFPAVADVPTIQQNIDINYPPFDTEIPDQYRLDVFLLEFNNYVKNGNLPTLTYIWLCDDHTSGISPTFPTPAAQVADNDLALGRLVEAISHSPYWKDSVIFVTEDDAQDGVDHVDGHRTEGLLIGPYVKRGVVDSTLYSQVNMVRTIEQTLGLPPMNQHDLVSEPMRRSFTDDPDFTPYDALPSNIPLDTLTLSTSSNTPKLQAAWQKVSAKIFARPLKPDSVNPALLNRAIWYGTKGFATPYPGDKKVLMPNEVPLQQHDD